jgi:hypothetical protein
VRTSNRKAAQEAKKANQKLHEVPGATRGPKPKGTVDETEKNGIAKLTSKSKAKPAAVVDTSTGTAANGQRRGTITSESAPSAKEPVAETHRGQVGKHVDSTSPQGGQVPVHNAPAGVPASKATPIEDRPPVKPRRSRSKSQVRWKSNSKLEDIRYLTPASDKLAETFISNGVFSTKYT